MNVSSVPAMTPGIDSGSVTLRNVDDGVAYRSRDASSSRPSSRSRLAYNGSTMNGRKLYTSPHTTAAGVASSRKSSGNNGSERRKPVTGPLSDRIDFHASVRTRNVVKNGA